MKESNSSSYYILIHKGKSMQYISLFCALIILQFACDDATPSRNSIDELDQEMMTDSEISSDMSSDIMLDLGPLRDDGGQIDPDMSELVNLDMMADMELPPLDEGINDMTTLSDLGDLIEDLGVDSDMEVLEPDMILDMESTPPGLQIRDTCESSDECAEGLSCLGWPTGSFCTPTCGYSPPASGRPSNPDCPPGFALECHVSNNCIPTRCTNDCDSGYICDESNRCAPYE
jgi:hypothetical protein